MDSGNPENQNQNPSDGSPSERIVNSKKQKITGKSLDLKQVVRSVGATTPNATGATGSGSSSSQQQKPQGSYNGKIGIAAMQNAVCEESTTIEMDDESMENEWIDVQRARERYFVAIVDQDRIFGDTKAKKRDELKNLLVIHKIHCTEGPTDTKSDEGAKVFRVAVESQADMDQLLSLTIEDEDEGEGTGTFYKMFKRLDNARKTSEQERSIEIYGLHPRTDEFRIRSALSQYGDIQKVTTRPCSRGVKVTARIIFGKEESVVKFKETGKKCVFIGRDLARVSMIGSEKVRWELNFVAKLSGLPVGTTTLDLQPLLGEDKAEFIIIPKIFGRGGKFITNQREAFVYFSTQADMESNMEVPVRLGGHETNWGDREEKRCRECGKLGHIQRECEVYIELQTTRAHIKAVKEYQKGGPLKITGQKSYAEMAMGNKAKNAGNKERQHQQQTQQQPTQHQQKEDSNAAQQNATNKLLNTMEKKISQLHDTIHRLQEEQLQVTQMNSVLMSMVIQMFSQQMGITIPKEQLQAAGLSTDISRNAMKNKKDTSAAKTSIPQTNESLGLLMTLLNASKTQTQRHQLPETSTGQTSKSKPNNV
ncbi:hypothetical protein BGZ46_003133 [Entomortierella lignicola]|nr:hypothetical protein BGZ46_003133 [Entomortierella lignicola]